METEIRTNNDGTFGVFARSVGYGGSRGHWRGYANFPTQGDADNAATELRGETQHRGDFAADSFPGHYEGQTS